MAALSVKSQAKLTTFEWTRSLDAIARLLITEYGVTEAYRRAAVEMEGRGPCGARLEDLAGVKGSTGQDLASERFEGSTCRAKC